jgi:ribose-phosphate pyrophosphokinase
MSQGPLLFSGNSNPDLAERIARYLGRSLGRVVVRNFSDGEIFVEIEENVRGRDCFIIQSTCQPVNNNIMEMLIMVDALRRASARRITTVIPYYGYARQDRKSAPRTPITAKLVANLLTAAGVNRALTLDLHAGQIQGFFDIPLDNLFAMPVMLEHLRPLYKSDETVIVAPDAGGTERARAYAKRLNSTLAVIDKRRTGPNVAEVMHLIGEVDGKTAIIVDDMVDTAGTLTKGVEALMKHGAKSVVAAATHGVLSGPAIKRIEESPITSLIVTNSIPLSAEAKACSKIQVLSVAELLGEAIRRISEEASVSSLFV